MRFQLLAARLALTALVLAALMAGAAVAGVRLQLMPFASGLTLMTPAVAMAAIALICSLAWLAGALKRNEGTGKRAGLIALLGSLALLWPPLHALYGGLTAPPIHDVATDPEDPPQFVALAKLRRPGMNPVGFDGARRITFRGETGTTAYILHEYYSQLTKPVALIMSPNKMFWRSFEAAKRMGWTIVDSSEQQGRIEATSASFWFGQVSDIAIRVERAGTLGARLDVRAASETGDKDFGRNIALLKAYFRELNRK
jgi:Protein of unknown function (DUF1499)